MWHFSVKTWRPKRFPKDYKLLLFFNKFNFYKRYNCAGSTNQEKKDYEVYGYFTPCRGKTVLVAQMGKIKIKRFMDNEHLAGYTNTNQLVESVISIFEIVKGKTVSTHQKMKNYHHHCIILKSMHNKHLAEVHRHLSTCGICHFKL